MRSLNKIVISLAIISSQIPSIVFAEMYLGIEGGDSISTNAHFQPKITFPRDNAFVVATPANTDWTRDIGSAGLVGAFIGYECNPNLALQFDYTYRSGYDWNILVLEDDAIFAPEVYDRYQADNIRIQTFLFDLVLKPCVDWGAFVPYIKGGIGVAHNRIDGIHNIDIPATGEPLSVNSQIEGNSSTNFAWNVGLGADYYINNKFSVGLGYRFVDTGRLRSGNNFTDTVSGITSTISPFEAKHIYLNELTVCLTYHFHCL